MLDARLAALSAATGLSAKTVSPDGADGNLLTKIIAADTIDLGVKGLLAEIQGKSALDQIVTAGVETNWVGSDKFGLDPNQSLISPAFTDLDGDGDVDLLMGGYWGTFFAFRNGTNGTTGVFKTWDGPALFNGLDAGYMSTPAFTDFDGDGDMDMVAGSRENMLSLYLNGNTGTSGVFTQILNSSRLAGVTYTGDASDPIFQDMDGDGDQDLVLGNGYGELFTYKNGTTGAKGAFKLWGTGDPLANASIAGGSCPAFIDLDNDGDKDLVTGSRDGKFFCFRNGTNGTSGNFVAWQGTDPFKGLDIGIRSDPAFADIDRDGDLDFITGSYDFKIYAYENTAAKGAAPNFNITGSPAAAIQLADLMSVDGFHF